MQAFVRPGNLAVLEANTHMSESHRIIFDALEYEEGQKLSGCCNVPRQQPLGGNTIFASFL